MDNSNKNIVYRYKFRVGDDEAREFVVKLDAGTLNLVQAGEKSYPQWTKLTYFQCPNCPLTGELNSFCPVASGLVDLVDFFKSSISYEEVDVLIDAEGRRSDRHISLQSALSSLVGIYMVANTCPIMEKLKPMVRFHLPLATMQETQYRVVSMYLLAQYFISRRGGKPDWDLKNLVKLYDDIRIVNQTMCKRLSSLGISDAILNAVVKLDSFADAVSFAVNENMLSEIEPLFNAYLA